ncbi:Glycosyltransferase Family 90 domain containing protein [Tulasnella sp. JGI-2019a]|nr:Glycosyltransferase Family 90 domain containing protein [Tulasnella sp. JGI-2019a]
MSFLGLRRFTRIILVAAVATLGLTAFVLTVPPTHPARSHIQNTLSSHASQLQELRKTIKLPWKDHPVVLPEPGRHSNDRPNTLGLDAHTAHVYQSDGRVKVNEHGPHPIYELSNKAERDWRAKQSKSSRTLHDAVSEYKRRYGRSPPPGFDKWWQYVLMNRVALPDEYDQIHKDLEPFWGIHPDELRTRQTAAESRRDAFTIAVTDGKAAFTSTTSTPNEESLSEEGSRRAMVQLEVLQFLAKWLPDLRASFSVLDTPSLLLDHDYHRAAVNAARSRTVLAPHRDFTSQGRGIASSCSLSSPLVASSYPPPIPNIPAMWTTTEKSFIHNHTLAMDVCLNPSTLHLHGFMQSLNNMTLGTRLEPLFPLFSPSSTSIHGDIHIPSLYAYEDLSDFGAPDWNQKQHSKLYWRGNTTGTYHSATTFWNLTQRVRLVEAANEKTGDIWVMPSTMNRMEPVGAGERIERAFINEEWVDVKFTGKPVQCDPDSTCALMETLFPFDSGVRLPTMKKVKGSKKPVLVSNDETHWKYLMDIDGNGPSSSFKKRLATKSLVFKSTVFTEWFTDRIQPWLHYIPIKPDYTDVYDVMAFFKGDIDGIGQDHDAMADVMARAGHKWQFTMSREEDMLAYVFRLLLEYARVMSHDREQLNFEL